MSVDAGCGDGERAGDERCDGGYGDETDACLTCDAAGCGAGHVPSGIDTCDGGDRGDVDACTSGCQVQNGGSCAANLDCVSAACVAERCVDKPALQGACDDDDDCSVTEASACTMGTCLCAEATCGGACVDTAKDANHCGGCDHSCLGGECLAGKCQPFELANGQPSPIRIAVNARGVFWANYSEGGTVVRATHDGSSRAQQAAPEWGYVYGIAVDADYVYYAHRGPPEERGAVSKVPIDGVTPTPVLVGRFTPYEIAVDADNVYVASYEDSLAGLAQVSKLGGTPIWFPNTFGAWSVVTSAQTDQIYWSNYDARAVYSAPIGGGAVRPVTMAGGGRSIAILDATLYFTSDTSVQSVAIAGGEPTTIAGGERMPHGLAVDQTGLYWTNEQGGSVKRWTLPDGPVETLAERQEGPAGIALDADAVYWVNQAGGQVMKLAKPKGMRKFSRPDFSSPEDAGVFGG